MISEIYRKYFQKSYTFLYPLLGFHKSKHPKPYQTYLAWPGVCDPEDRKLVCVYERDATDEWREFEREILITHKSLDQVIPVDDELIAYVFDMNPFKEDLDAFLTGKYSRMSVESKKKLTDYYGVHTPEWVYIESFLFPEKYFSQYAKILDVDEDLIRQVGELCEGYDREREVYQESITNNP